jgi:hypothetical protein
MIQLAFRLTTSISRETQMQVGLFRWEHHWERDGGCCTSGGSYFRTQWHSELEVLELLTNAAFYFE